MRRSNQAPVLLGIGAFVVGTCELVLAGLLPELGRSLGIAVATAGQVVTIFGVTAAIAGPALAAATVRRGPQRALLLALIFYLLGTALSSVASSFGLLLGAQVLAACGAGLFLPTATVVAAELVEQERRGRAVATVTTGMTVAIAIGAPLGTALAAVTDWRVTMATLSALALLVGVAVLRWVPQVQTSDHDVMGLRQRWAPLVDRRVLALLVTTLVSFTAIYIPYTYISVVLADSTRGNGLWLAAVMSVLGISGIAGNLLSGRLADRLGGRPVVAGALLGLIAVFGLMPLWSTTIATSLLAAAAYGLIGFGVSAPQTYRILALGGRPSLTVALNGAALYVAIALSGVLGGVAVTALGPSSLGPLATAGLVLALGMSELSHRLTSKSQATTRA